MQYSYHEHEMNYRFFRDHLKRVGIEPEEIVSAEIPLHRAARSGFSQSVVALWLIGYARSRAGMYEHARSA
jgi:hypothetical protein